MAIDEALLHHIIRGDSPPTLRVFSWEPECLSLGFMQQADERLVTDCERFGISLVRRPTGGYAVLHGEDLCYSVVAKMGDGPLPASLQSANMQISLSLRAALHCLGVPAEISETKERETSSYTACAEAASLYEITVRGKKIIGSAQMQSQGHLLQHGSIALNFDPARIATLLNLNQAGERELTAKATDLRQAGGRVFSREEICVALAGGFSKVFAVEMQPGDLTEKEQLTAETIRREHMKNFVSQRGKTCV